MESKRIGSLTLATALLAAACGAATATPISSIAKPSVPAAVAPSVAATSPASIAPASPVSSPISGLPAHGRIAFGLESGTGSSQITNILTVEPDGSGLQTVTNLSVGCDRIPSWTSAGNQILFSIGVPDTDTCDGSESEHLAVMDANGGNVHQLTAIRTGVFDDSAVVSPDGMTIVFDRFDLSGRLTGIWLINRDGSLPVQLTKTPKSFAGGDQAPSFSPDGKEVVFARDRLENEGDGALEIVRADGTGLHQVPTGSVHANRPSFSPDGTTILFDSPAQDGSQNIYVIGADGHGLKALTAETKPDEASNPAWSPDGTKIVFTEYHAGDNFVGLVVMNADGSDPIVTWHPTPKTDNFPDWPSWGTAP